MELRQITYFIAIAEVEHFGLASKRLRVAQPALSRQMKLLEKEIGADLFERLPRGVRLTDAGRVFLTSARDLRARLQRSLDEVRATDAGNSGSLRLGFIEVVGWEGLVPEGIRRFRSRFPSVKLILSAMSTAEQLAQLRQGLIDVALVYNPSPDDDIEIAPLAQHAVMLAVPFDSPFYERESVTLSDLAGVDIIGFHRQASPRYHDELATAFHGAGVTPHYIAEMKNETDMLALVSAGAGVALINARQQWRRPHLVRFIPVMDLNVRLQLAFVHVRANKSPVLQRFHSALTDI